MAQTKAQLLGPVVGDLVMDVSTLSLDAEGNKVGIGTTGATATLHVFEPTEGDAVVQFNSGDNFPTVNRGLVLKAATGPTGYTGSKWIFDAQSSGGRLEFQTASTPRLTILEGGNIGIGTANPAEKLHVQGDIRLVDNSPRIGFHDANAADNLSCTGGIELFDSAGNRGAYMGATEGANFLSFGISPSAGAAPTEKLRITSDGHLQVKGGNLHLDSNPELALFEDNTSGSYTNSAKIAFDFSGNVARIRTSFNGSGSIRPLAFYTGNTERLRITSDGTVHINSADSASGGRIYAASSKLYLQSGNGRQSVNIADMASGSTATHEFNSSGNLVLAGSLQGTGVNLQSSSTSSWFQTGTNLYSTNYVWAAKDSSSNTWHSGLQTDGDLLLGNVLNDARIGIYGSSGNMGLKNATTSAKLNVSTDISGNYTGWKEKGVAAGSMSAASIASKTPTINDFTYPNNSDGMLIWSTSKIGFAAGAESPQYGNGVQMLFDSAGLMLGGNRAFDRTSSVSTNTDYTVRLRTNGDGVFKGSLYANPFSLTSSNSWIKSAYGAISNSTVSSLNNLLIGQNMRGYVSGIDGGSVNNNFYNIVTYGAGSMGHAGTEYCFGGITKFYNDTDASTANTAFTPKERFRITTGGVYVGGAYYFSNNNTTYSELPNPYVIGNVNANNVAYPHIPGIYLVSASSPCDNTWRTLFTSINDSNWIIEGTSGDASSKRKYKIIGNPTSPSYGVNLLTEDYHTGGWNTGDIEFRLDGTHPNWNLQVKCTSYYSTSNTSGIKFMLFVLY